MSPRELVVDENGHTWEVIATDAGGAWVREPGIPYETLACADCGMRVAWYGEDGEPVDGTWEYYMVHDSVWDEAGLGRGYLCIGCLEARLGRRLTRHDFSDSEINGPSPLDTPRLNLRFA